MPSVTPKRSSQLPLVIVTPSFNQGRFIGQTIESILDQGYEPLTYYVVDGKSSDDTVNVLKRYGSKIKWVSENDKGQTDAINKGLNLACKGLPDEAIVAYINSDDYYLPGAFQTVVRLFTANSEKMWLVGDCQIVTESGKETQVGLRWYKTFWRHLLSRPVLAVLNPIPQPAVFVRVGALRKLGLFDVSLRYTMDYEYWLRLLHAFGRPIIVDQALAAFRLQASSKGMTQFDKQFAEEYEVAKRYVDSPFLLFLHRLHSTITTSIYKLIK